MSASESGCHTACALRDALDRRAFLSQTMLAAASVLLVACGGGGDDDEDDGITLPPPGTVFDIRVSDHPALATVGGVARVQASPPLAMARTSAGYSAFSLVCTHQGSIVTIRSDSTLLCTNHGAEFAFDGRWTGGAQRTGGLIALTTTFDPATGIARITI